jgi:hypothetical protein
VDLLVLIDKLDDIVHNARPVPLTDQVRVDKAELYEVLDQIRAALPAVEAGPGTGPPAGLDQQMLSEAVSAAIKQSIPEIARAVAAASAARPPGPPPPGGPF